MIIIDAYNCLHAGSSIPGPWRGFSLRELCRLMVRQDKKTVLVMDGTRKPDEPAGDEFPDVKMVYSGRGVSADSVIIAMVNNSTGARHITVVSNDRAVKAGAHRGGARTVACEKYLNNILRRRTAARQRWKTAEPEWKSSGQPPDTDYWLHEFGFKTIKNAAKSNDGAKRYAESDFNIEDINMEEILRRRSPGNKH